MLSSLEMEIPYNKYISTLADNADLGGFTWVMVTRQ